MSTFSIIVPVYNAGEEFLRRCIRSVLAQDDADYELILVDDGSTDNSGAICDEYAAIDARVHAIHKQNGGVTTARNIGVDAATGKWLLFIDNDDWIADDTLSILRSLVGETAYDFVLFDSNQIREDGICSVNKTVEYVDGTILTDDQKRLMLLDTIATGYHNRQTGVGIYTVWCKLISREFMLQNHIRFYEDMTIADDVMFNVDCWVHSTGQVLYVERALYQRYNYTKSDSYRWHSEIVENDRNFLQHMHQSLGDLVKDPDIKEALYKRYVVCVMGVSRFDMRHRENLKSRIERANDLKRLSRNAPYKDGIFYAKWSWFNKDQIKLLLLLKLHMEWIMVNVGR